MSTECKPIWSEGMLMRPQHFQQYDRWIEHYLTERVAPILPFGFGLTSLEIATDLLPMGKFSLTQLKIIMQDGSVVDMPRQIPTPPVRNVRPENRSSLIKLAIPIRARDSAEISNDGHLRRYQAIEQDVRDVVMPDRAVLPIKVAQLSARIVFDGEPADECILIPIAKIKEVEASGAIQLDPDYAPPCLDLHISPRLVQFVNEVRSMLKNRADTLRAGDLDRSGSESSTMMDIMALSIIGGHESRLNHFAVSRRIHPENIYKLMVEITGELAAFSKTRRRSSEPLPYDHLDCMSTFKPLLEVLREQLSVVVERNIISLPLQDRGYGIRTATITDRTLFQDSQFILVVYADVPADVLRSRFPTTLKIGSIEKIRQLVNLQLPGVTPNALAVAPRALPFMQNAVYFELDQAGDHWRDLIRSAAFAFHVSGEYPGLHIEFWVIRGQRS